MSEILSLAPQNVWKHFYSLTQIPRPSGHLKKIQAFLLEFGKNAGVETFQDEAGNIIYRKPATPGMENRKTVILQAHMDMVPQKNKDTQHDFENDPIQTYVDGEWVRAKGTTLGADNGMGVAAIMTVMEDKTLKHGPLQALITADEETGMYGAFGLKPGTVEGEILHPADIAELCNELDAEEARFVYLLLDNETAADVLIEMDEDVRKRFLELLPSETIAKRFVDYMDSDDAVDIIREMDEDKQEEVLSHIEDIEQAGDIVDLLKYDEDTAGGLMGTEMVIVNENWSMPECLREMRIQAEEMDEIYYVYVVDDDERLRGVFPLKKMITSPSVSKVKHVMKKDPISVHVDMPVEEVVQTIEKYDLVAVPVVDSIGRLVGRITVDDVMDEVREQAERDYQLASGLSQDVESDDNVFRQTTARLPWLLIGMLGGIGNSMILGNFDTTFAAHPEMALYIPLIGGTGGNVGTQSSALVVQGLANSSLDAGNTFKQVLKESVVALINATIISMLVYIYNFIRFGASATVSYSVSISLFAVVMFASIFGTLVPMTLEKLKIDPAIATGPFISITNDIIGMLMYMGITVLLS
jgi:magnesium transporter